MSARPTLIFDFDSTLVDFETLEALADTALADAPGAADKRAQIAALTDQAMAGEIEFGEALRRRLALLPLTRAHAICFGAIWTALALFTFDGLRAAHRARIAAAEIA